MKIMYSLITAPPSKIYGGERHHLVLAKYLKRIFDDEISLVCYDVNAAEEIWRKPFVGNYRIEEMDFAEVFRLPAQSFKAILFNPLSFIFHNILYKMSTKTSNEKILRAISILSNFYSLRIGYTTPKLIEKVLNLFRPDIVHAYGVHLFWLPYILSRLALKRKDIGVVIWTLYHHFVPYERILFSRPKILQLINDSHIVITSTRYERNLIHNLIKDKYSKEIDKIRVLPVPVDLEQFIDPPKELLEDLRERIGNPDRIVLTMTLNHIKGSLNVLRALKDYYSNEKIAFVSFGRCNSDELLEFKEITKQLPRNVSAYYLGYVSEEVKAGLYAIADVFAMPSIADSFGMAYVEAWYYDTPVIADKNPIMEEVIGDRKRGILVDRNNLKEIQEAINLIIDDENLSSKLVANGRRYLESELNAKQVARKVRRIYQTIFEH